ncbi:hypothetical protein RI129_006355 [Pyrocoelia pectoralis]|uniref:Kinesin motor domain-containing protein n=1 Tax=Pyrocoelia pectoralis TaxID=417401 RepID=A0AAN7VAK1_9COLE
MELKTEPTRFKNAKIYYRLFPMVNMRWEHVKVLEDMKTLYVRYTQDFGIGREGVVPSYWRFITDGIFYNNSQLDIYNTVMADTLDKVIDGCSAVILSFGQSGTGKSVTVSGLQNCYKVGVGIAPRVISDLFLKKDVLKNQTNICVQLSYVETKNMCLKDLLNEDTRKHIRSFQEISLKRVKTEDDALELAENSTTSHGANGVFTITVVAAPANTTDPMKKTSKLHIVDLGGVDSYGNLTSFNKNISQVRNGNVAKTQLEQFMLILIQNRPDCILVKQRLNVLIQYLGDSLNAQSILRCIGHVRVDLPNLYITISLLNFGQYIRGLKPKKLQPNISKNEEIEIKLLKKQIIGMRKENDLNAMLGSDDLASNVTQDRVLQMQHVAQEYLEDTTDELVVLNVTDACTVLKVFKDLYNKLEIEKVECSKVAYEEGYEIGYTTAINTEGSAKMPKSKENIGIGKSKPSQTTMFSKASPRKASSTTSKIKSADKSGGLKRSRGGSLTTKRPSMSKKMSNNGSIFETSTPLTDLSESSKSMPKNFPQYEEAWNLFTKAKAYNYAKLEKDRISSEVAAKNLQLEYLDVIKKLQKCFEMVGLRKSELNKAEMRRLFNQQVYDENGKVILSETEVLCLNNCKSAQDELLSQQEFVLKKQAEFTLAVEEAQSIKKNIDEKFEEFCRQNYQLMLPNGSSQLEMVYESGEISALADEEVSTIEMSARELRNIQFYNKLQRLLKEQILAEIKFKRKSKPWH